MLFCPGMGNDRSDQYLARKCNFLNVACGDTFYMSKHACSPTANSEKNSFNIGTSNRNVSMKLLMR